MISMNMDTMLAVKWRAAIYCRLSKDDDLQGESASIANQRAILENHCAKQGWEVVYVLQDDGFTGLNMDRPDMQKLLKLVEMKSVNLVITKDLSRLSRNYLDAGRLTEDFFPRNGVRYIALNDGIDTLKENNDIAPFKNILNEMYSKDISKKVHSSYLLKATQGKFTGCLAPFGYRKDPDNKNHLLIDEDTAPIVRKIFDYAMQGHGPNYIRRRMENEKIPCPTWWNRKKGLRRCYTKWERKDPDNGRFMWDFSVIQDLLANPVYIGAIASQKMHYRFKLGVIGEKKPEEWVCVENMHEPIIDRKTFGMVQQKVKSRQRPDAWGNYSLFSGLIKCGDCGKALTIRKTNAKQPISIYACVTYNKFGKGHCTQHRVEYDALYQTVLAEIQRLGSIALRDRDAIMARLMDASQDVKKAENGALARSVTKDKERLAFLEKMISRLYEDMLSGAVNEENFRAVLSKTQAEQRELKARVEQTEQALSSDAKQAENTRLWLDTIQAYANITELDAEMLHRLIREIIVHETISDSGERKISVEIHYNLKPISEN